MATFSLKDFLREARRRRVFRVTAIYIVGAWVALQAADLAFPGLGIEESAILYVLIGAILGLPIALFFGWRYDIIGGQIVRTAVSDTDADLSIERADYVILVALSVVVAAIAFGLVGEISKTRIPETAQSAVGDTNPNSIAVLPFLNMSDDPEQEYFSDGISEEILNLLAKIPEMRVTSRSSAFSFKGQNLDVPTMAAKLNVAHVLEGSVRKSGNQLRITAQLIEVVTDTHLWSQTYDRELEDIFAIQDDIAGAVVDALKITLLGETPKATETDPEAYTLYLQARHFAQQLNAETIKQAEALLKQALEIDPGFAPAWITLGRVYQIGADPIGVRPIDESTDLARDAYQRALAIDPQNDQALAFLALIEGDDATAYDYLRQALASNPGDAPNLRRVGWMELERGRIDEAIDLTERSNAIDPISPVGHNNLAFMYYFAHRLDEAAESSRVALSLNPDMMFPHYVIGIVRLAQGDAPAALAAMEQENGDWVRLHGMAIIQHALGDDEASDAALQAVIECCTANAGYQVALLYAFRGEIDKAFEWLDLAYDNDDTGGVIVMYDPLFANLHDDPRWGPFLDKMGLAH
jgi:TolB-like protein/cytochrome c-type biogenesis protein CcmH/NrfG